MTPFDEAMSWLLSIEGVLSMDPSDPGNWTGGKRGVGELRGTKYGISAKQFPALDIVGLTIKGARDIYEVQYWTPPKCEQLPGWAGLALFDAYVNHNPKDAVKMFQRALHITQDGVVGPKTIDVAKHSTLEAVLPLFLSYRSDLYRHLAIADGNFLGWSVRLFRLQNACLRLAIRQQG